jgi:hypothetical protein
MADIKEIPSRPTVAAPHFYIHSNNLYSKGCFSKAGCISHSHIVSEAEFIEGAGIAQSAGLWSWSPSRGVRVERNFRWSRSGKEFLGGIGVGKNVPTPTSV